MTRSLKIQGPLSAVSTIKYSLIVLYFYVLIVDKMYKITQIINLIEC